MSKRSVMLVISAAIAAAVLALLVCAPPRPQPLNVSVSFKGFTTLPQTQQTMLASFCISNGGRFALIDIPPDLYKLRPDDPCFDVIPYSIGWPSILKPGQSTTIFVPAPLNNGPEWKVLIKLAQFDWRFKFGNMPSKVQSVVGSIIPRHILRVREPFELETDWITNAEPTQLPKEALNRVP